MRLDSRVVNDIFMECLFNDDETKEPDVSDAVISHGIVMHVGFHPGRLEKNRHLIVDLLAQLPANFFEGRGGGWSFLKFGEDMDGRVWADNHVDMEKLVLLGQAIGAVRPYSKNRFLWASLPGGMPYYTVSLPS